mmetsp:Transcript_12839/g.11371  ORF Transcript_12839/g.11371 Transcript_12839/m.11371 type:complete len:80 (-) Transcript_12839:1448-1687(-)
MLFEINKIYQTIDMNKKNEDKQNQEKMRYYGDLKYKDQIIKLMPPEIRNDIAIKDNILGQLFDMASQIKEEISRWRRKK